MQTLDLSGTWHVTWAEAGRGLVDSGKGPDMDPAWYFEAQVPGEVHLDMVRAGVIDDPHVGLNILKARWVEEMIWSYRKHFTPPADARRQRCWLVLDQLELAAKVFLNGELVGEHANSFYPCRLDVTDKLIDGENRVVVQVEAGLEHTAELPRGHLTAHRKDIPVNRLWMRRPQFQAGWDWSGRMLNVGVTGPVRLEWTDAPVRAGQFVPLARVADDLASASLEARLWVEALGQTDEPPARVELTAELPELGLSGSVECELPAGEESCCSVTLEVPEPELWWPIGLGEQKLHEVRVVLRHEGRVLAERVTRVGFRHVRVNRDPHPVEGEYFVVEINGRKVFCKGGNFVPPDMICAAADEQRYEKLVDRAIEANFNFLRIWGGGQYERETLYRLCDERGLMVWQEFIFACGQYPGYDKRFADEIRREATWQVRRLAGHPSLVVWCGNNELDWLVGEGMFKTDSYLADYALFHHLLPRVIKEEDPTRFYWPSSPISADHDHANARTTGDQHTWELGFVDKPEIMDFTRYRDMTARFPNEGGFLGPNSLPTVRAIFEDEERVGNFAWQVHDNTFWNDVCKWWLGRPRTEMSVPEWVYWGGLLHGEALKEFCESYRRQMYDCASAIFWMYNDTWPCARSWTIVDYYLRRTPAFHPVRRAMAPVHVVLHHAGGQLTVYGVNDTDAEVSATLEHGLFALAGEYPMRQSAEVTLAPNASTPLVRFSGDNWQRDRAMAFAMLRRPDGTIIARNRLFEGFWKDMTWPVADVKVRLEDRRAVFSCETFALGVCLDLDGEKKLSDNYFDLYPGIEYAIDWDETQPPEILAAGNLA